MTWFRFCFRVIAVTSLIFFLNNDFIAASYEARRKIYWICFYLIYSHVGPLPCPVRVVCCTSFPFRRPSAFSSKWVNRLFLVNSVTIIFNSNPIWTKTINMAIKTQSAAICRTSELNNGFRSACSFFDWWFFFNCCLLLCFLFVQVLLILYIFLFISSEDLEAYQKGL